MSTTDQPFHYRVSDIVCSNSKDRQSFIVGMLRVLAFAQAVNGLGAPSKRRKR